MASSSGASSSSTAPPKSVHVQVVARCRPLNDRELRANKGSVIATNSVASQVEVHQDPRGRTTKAYSFDCVYGPDSTQRDIYNKSISPVIGEVLEGYNCTIFAYGQTSTGKTYTMEGAEANPSGMLTEHSGVIPRAVADIFRRLEGGECADAFTVKVSVLELYNEELSDLLTADEKKLSIFEDNSGKGVFVQNLEEVVCKTAQDIHDILNVASERRQIAETRLNKHSSRSHVITTITIHMKEGGSGVGEEIIKTGKLNLVDLAGSENIGRSGAVAKQAKEAGNINQSLLTLGRVISALTEKQPHVPYRESKLTRLLKESLGGRAKTLMIATLSPSGCSLEETLSTLEYASRAKNIRNQPQQNQRMTQATLMKEMAHQIEDLRRQLQHQMDQQGGVFVKSEEYEKMQGQLSARASALEELVAKIEELEKQKKEYEDLFAVTQEELDREKSGHAKTQKSLEHTVSVLHTTKDKLHEKKVEVLQKDACLSERERVEALLMEEALSLKSNLQTSIQDIEGFTAKIGRKQAVENSNKEVVRNFHRQVHDRMEEMLGRLDAFRLVHHHANQSQKVLHERIRCDEAKILGGLSQQAHDNQAEVSQAIGKLRESLANVGADNEDGFKGILEQLDAVESAVSGFEQKFEPLVQLHSSRLQEVVAAQEMAFQAYEQHAQQFFHSVLQAVQAHTNAVQEGINGWTIAFESSLENATGAVNKTEESATTTFSLQQQENAKFQETLMATFQEMMSTHFGVLESKAADQLKKLQATTSSAHADISNCKRANQQMASLFGESTQASQDQVSVAVEGAATKLQEEHIHVLQQQKDSLAEECENFQTSVLSEASRFGATHQGKVAATRQGVTLRSAKQQEWESSTEGFLTSFEQNTLSQTKRLVDQVQNASESVEANNKKAQSMVEEVVKVAGDYDKDQTSMVDGVQYSLEVFVRDYQDDMPTGETPIKKSFPVPTDLPSCPPYQDIIARIDVLLEDSMELESGDTLEASSSSSPSSATSSSLNESEVLPEPSAEDSMLSTTSRFNEVSLEDPMSVSSSTTTGTTATFARPTSGRRQPKSRHSRVPSISGLPRSTSNASLSSSASSFSNGGSSSRPSVLDVSTDSAPSSPVPGNISSSTLSSPAAIYSRSPLVRKALGSPYSSTSSSRLPTRKTRSGSRGENKAPNPSDSLGRPVTRSRKNSGLQGEGVVTPSKMSSAVVGSPPRSPLSPANSNLQY